MNCYQNGGKLNNLICLNIKQNINRHPIKQPVTIFKQNERLRKNRDNPHLLYANNLIINSFDLFEIIDPSKILT